MNFIFPIDKGQGLLSLKRQVERGKFSIFRKQMVQKINKFGKYFVEFQTGRILLKVAKDIKGDFMRRFTMFQGVHLLGRTDPNLKTHATKSRSFTLVELLVVISIFMVLISLVSSSLKQVMEKSVELQCLNNMKTIAGAQSLYAQDFNECWIVSSSYSTRGGWAGVLNKPSTLSFSSSSTSHALGYMTDVRAMYCPNAPGYPDFVSRPSPYSTYGALSTEYQYTALKYRFELYFLMLPVNLSQRPDMMAPILDTTNPYNNSGGGYYVNSGRNISLRHNGRSSSAFLDGHAKSIAIDEFQMREVLLQNMNQFFFDSKATMDSFYNLTSYREAYTKDMLRITWTPQ